MMQYTFFADGEWYTVLACTYDAACRSFRLEFGGQALDHATLVKVTAA